MHKQWNIISQDFPGLERNPGIKIPVKMTRDPETEPLVRRRAGIERELASRADQSIDMVWACGKNG